jgi:methyl-accepting chemotaxis protein
MSDLTRDDINRAVQDNMRDLVNNVSRIKDQVERTDQQSSDHNARVDRLRQDVEDIKLRTQNIERGVQQITAYLQAEHEREQEDAGFKGA